jgi:hypothetical protein
MPTLDGSSRSYTCRCGHDDEQHTDGVCTVTDCYCGRDPLAGRPRERCRWCSTGADIVWCRTLANSKPIPIEPDPNPAGNVEIVAAERGVPIVQTHKGPPGMFDEWTPYMPHHATCDQKLGSPRKQPKGQR